MDFAVVDFETTGLHTRGHDRILEVAILRLDADGRERDRFVSLVNPERDVGPTHLHGIFPRDIRDAPVFGDISGDVLRLMQDAIFVAHNSKFDTDFLEAELARLELKVPAVPVLCTQRWGRWFFSDSPSDKLSGFCSHLGIRLDQEHSALHDASACADLLRRILAVMKGTGLPYDPLQLATRSMGSPEIGKVWPALPRRGQGYSRDMGRAARKEALSVLGTVLSTMPETGGTPDAACRYHELLQSVLLDNRISLDEHAKILEEVNRSGLSRELANGVHRDFMRDRIFDALKDGRVTPNESHYLVESAELLQLSQADVGDAWRAAEALLASNEPPAEPDSHPCFPGKTFAITGTPNCRVSGYRLDKEDIARYAAEHGLVYHGSLRKKTTDFVVGDRDSESKKMSNAAKWNKPVISEYNFLRMLGVDIE